MRSTATKVGVPFARPAGLMLAALSLAVSTAVAAPPDLDSLLQSLRSTAPGPVQPRPAEPPRVSLTPDGYVSFLGAPPASGYPVAGAVAGKPEVTARSFLRENAGLLGVDNPAIDFQVRRSEVSDGHTHVRFQQTYAGVPVFSGEVTVQIGAADTVECVLSDVLRQTQALDQGRVPVNPALTAQDAAAAATQLMIGEAPNGPLAVTDPQLMIFDPAVLDAPGSQHLVWMVEVTSEQDPSIGERMLLDAATGEPVRRYPLALTALDRRIYDSNNTTADPGTLRRSEGGAASTIAEVNNAYEFFGDTYNFYSAYHGRNGINNAGMTISGTTRYCSPGKACPYSNAFWNGSRFYFGDGFTKDDITAHEYTHGVTQYESGLVYENHSGAINESFSDVWGEFVDLTNGAGNDTAAVRWLLGEDLGAARDMQDPPVYNDPDRLNSPLFIAPVADPNSGNDYGGVHTNSGVNNKLCYLLTDGDTFNGQTVSGMGITTVVRLYYEAQTNILTSGASYTDLYHALRQAAVNRGWTVDQRNNLYRACLAVEIADRRDWYVNGAWSGIQLGTLAFPFKTVTAGNAAANPGDRLFIKAGSYPETVVFDKILEINATNGTAVIGE